MASQASKMISFFFGSLIRSPILKDLDQVPASSGAQAGDSAPLRIIAPSFVVRKLGQKIPYPGAANIITVTLAVNVDLLSSDSSKITLQGLYGAATPDSSLAISDDAMKPVKGENLPAMHSEHCNDSYTLCGLML